MDKPKLDRLKEEYLIALKHLDLTIEEWNGDYYATKLIITEVEDFKEASKNLIQYLENSSKKEERKNE